MAFVVNMRQLAEAAKSAARKLARAPTSQKRAALTKLAALLVERQTALLAANELDLAAARAAGLAAPLVERLRLDVRSISRTVNEVAALEDPVGQVVESWRRPNGLRVERVRIPLGTIFVIYESRPNVTTDTAALCLLSGNACILRGGSEAAHSNAALLAVVGDALEAAGLPRACVTGVPTTDRSAVLELLKLDDLIDLAIPRGGEGLIRFVVDNARVPVVRHYKGVCHVFLDASADAEMAERIVVNAKAQRPSVCNAAECLLVHEAAAATLLPRVARALAAKSVELRCDERSLALVKDLAGVRAVPAQASDYGAEFLDYVLAVKVVAGLDEALAHIERYGSLHTEAIITNDLGNANRFTREVDASCVLVNASTRFNDGGELGLGAEVGISTTKLHAFGPMGLRELTATRFVVVGEGQIRG